MKKLLVFILVLAACATSKKFLSDADIKTNLQKHVSILSSTKDLDASAKYIATEFKQSGLSAKGSKGYYQEFPIPYDGTLSTGTQLYVNAKSYKPQVDFFPLDFSANGMFIGYISTVGYGIYAPYLKHDDYLSKSNLNKKIFVIETGYPDNDSLKYSRFTLRERAEYAVTRGASAVIFINSDSSKSDPPINLSGINNSVGIPVVFAKRNAGQVLRYSIVTNCVVGVDIKWKENPVNNVIGYVNNKSASTVVIGAHYDGENEEAVASLIELGRYYAAKKDQKNNYLFIGFAGREAGMLGSKYLVEHPTIDSLKMVNYMLNLADKSEVVSDEQPFLNKARVAMRLSTDSDLFAFFTTVKNLIEKLNDKGRIRQIDLGK